MSVNGPEKFAVKALSQRERERDRILGNLVRERERERERVIKVLFFGEQRRSI